MMKTTRSYRIGTSRIKHGCNRYKNNYYKKKKKKKEKKSGVHRLAARRLEWCGRRME
jgi:hypothetical protein